MQVCCNGYPKKAHATRITLGLHAIPGLTVPGELQGVKNISSQNFLSLINMFITYHSDDFQQIRLLVDQINFIQAQSISHNLKGVASNLGLLNLSEKSKTLDSALLEYPLPKTHYEALIQLCEQELFSLTSHIDHLLKVIET